MPEKKILIAGGGIGGLAAALGLAQKDQRSLVLEQMSKLGEIGAGIQIGPNAFHALDSLGVGDEARNKAVYIDKLVLMDAVSDQEITALPLDEPFRERFGNPYAVVHRADLHGVLLDACLKSDLVEIKVDAHVTGFEQDGASVTAVMADGEKTTGAALIGADGLRSNIRAKIVGDGEPRVSGHTTFRSVIETEKMPEELRWNAATLWAGPKTHIVHYPLKGWKVFNLVATRDNNAPDALTGTPVSTPTVRDAFSHVCARAQKIIASGENWKAWVLCDREPVSAWTRGRVTLLGDAAHPTLQYYAQGACMAMEDAVCLGYCFGSYGENIENTLIQYNKMRAARTTRLQISSRLLGEHVYHPQDARAQMRNAVMSAMPTEEYYNRLEWLYGGTGLDTAR